MPILKATRRQPRRRCGDVACHQKRNYSGIINEKKLKL